jgi:hypothetical protein
MARLGTLTATGLSMSVLLGALMPEYAQAEQVSFTDPDIKARYVNFPSPQGHGEGRGYLVTPTKPAGKVGLVLVVHENRGLNPYVADVARRVAKAGFIAFAPDALHPKGGYPGNDDDGRALQSSLDRAKIEQDFIAAAKFLKSQEGGNGKLGAVGFCFGGYIVNMLAASRTVVNHISYIILGIFLYLFIGFIFDLNIFYMIHWFIPLCFIKKMFKRFDVFHYTFLISFILSDNLPLSSITIQ